MAGAVAMWSWLPRDGPRHVRRNLRAVVAEHARNASLLLNALAAGATFFAFVGIFTFATHRLTAAPFYRNSLFVGYAVVLWLLRELGRRDAEPWRRGLFVALVGGMVDAQLANDPGGERWSRLLDRAIEMFADDVGITSEESRP